MKECGWECIQFNTRSANKNLNLNSTNMHESSIDKGLALAQDECKLENTELNNWLVCYMERERERERLYYRLRRSNMTYETKSITFHVIRVKVSIDSPCSRNFTNECCNQECTSWLWVEMWNTCLRIVRISVVVVQKTRLLNLSHLMKGGYVTCEHMAQRGFILRKYKDQNMLNGPMILKENLLKFYPWGWESEFALLHIGSHVNMLLTYGRRQEFFLLFHVIGLDL